MAFGGFGGGAPSPMGMGGGFGASPMGNGNGAAAAPSPGLMQPTVLQPAKSKAAAAQDIMKMFG